MPVLESKKLATTFMSHFSGAIKLRWTHKGLQTQSDQQICRHLQMNSTETEYLTWCLFKIHLHPHLAKLKGKKRREIQSSSLTSECPLNLKKKNNKIRSSCSFTYALLCFNDSGWLLVFWLLSLVLGTLITMAGDFQRDITNQEVEWTPLLGG